MRKYAFGANMILATLMATAQNMYNYDQNKPFGFCTVSSRTDASSTYDITGGGCYTYPIPDDFTGTVKILKSTGQDMKGTIQNAIKQNNVVVLDGADGDFVVSSSIGITASNKTIIGINNARICTQWYVTDEIKAALDAAGVPSMSTSGGGGTLPNGKSVSEEAEYNTRRIIIEMTGDNSESYRNSGIFSLSGCQNIIIRNLTFQGPGSIDVGGNDLISCVSGAKNCWVDHCAFLDGMDGNFDITQKSDFHTVSWCSFSYTDRSYMHQNTNLIGSSDNETTGYLNTTFAFCWWGTGCKQRMPIARVGKIHMLNNYFSCSGSSNCINPRKNSEFLIEGNYFDKGVKRFYKNDGATAVTWTSSNYHAENNSLGNLDSFGNTVTVPYDYTIAPYIDVQSAVKEYAGATLKLVKSIENILIDDVTLRPGETKDLTLSLTSAVSDMSGVQFDVTLPNGFSLETKESTVYQLSQNQASDMVCNVNDLGNGTYRFMLYSNSLQKLKAGELMALNLKAGNSVALGNYTVSLSEVAFSDADGQLTNADGTIATIKLTNFYPAATNIEMPSTKIISGETSPLTLNLLESIAGCVGIQFDLVLPDGFSLEKDNTGKEYVISANQASDITCNLTTVGANVYRFMLYSNSLKEFVPGELMNINLKVNEEKPLDFYSISMPFALLSDIGGNVYNDNGTSANVKVTKLFTLLYQVDGLDYKSFNVEYEAAIIPEAEPTKEGHTFSGWSEIPATMPAHDVTVTGTFKVNKYKLLYQIDGVDYKSYEVVYGTKITPEPAPAKEGYSFSGWNDIPATMPAHDVTVTGTFSINSYKLTYTVDGEVYKSYEIEFGASITPETEPSKEGYTFSGWSEIPATMPARDVTVTGTFKVNKYKLTYVVDGVEYKSYSVEYGTTITPEPAPTKEGYTFSGWSEIPETMPAHDVTVTGSFSINKYKLTYTVDGEVYKTYEIEYGATITPEAEPTKEGYTFSGWSTIPTTMPAYDVTVTGTFKVNKYKVNYFVDNNPYYTDMVEYGAIITPPNVPEREGYDFAWVYIPDTMPAYDISIYGQYTIKTGIEEIMSNANGDVMIFTIDGKRVDNLKKGMNIIRMKDGTTRKVVVK